MGIKLPANWGDVSSVCLEQQLEQQKSADEAFCWLSQQIWLPLKMHQQVNLKSESGFQIDYDMKLMGVLWQDHSLINGWDTILQYCQKDAAHLLTAYAKCFIIPK